MKIAIVEDHRMFRAFLRHLAEEASVHEVVGEAADGAAGILLVDETKPEMLLLDLNLPDRDGFEVAEHTLRNHPGTKVLVLSSHCDDYTVTRILTSGVHGFVDKNDQPPETVALAIEAVAKGCLFFTEAVTRVRKRLGEDPKAFNKVLSPRELELLCLIGVGMTDGEVAKATRLSTGTVQWHRKKILTKLKLHTTRELMRYAMERGITKMSLTRPPGSSVP
jgi:two-component system response regulator NreC